MAVSSPTRNRRAKPWVRLVLWAIPIFIVLLIVGLIVARSAIDSYLRSERFRSFVAGKAGDTLHLISNEMVQMHGGIGMTDVHDAGLYLKRARAAEATFGGQSYHRDRYARLQGY